MTTAPTTARRPLLLMLAALVVAGAAVRSTRMTESLWYDEIAAWRDYGMHGPRAILTTYFDPANHVAHTLLSWCAFELLASFEWPAAVALRFPSFVFSLATIPILFGLGRRAGGIRVGIVAAAVAAIAPVAVLEGVEARGYSMMIFFAAAATHQWLALRTRPRLTRGLAYATLMALGVWSHPMTVFVALGHGVILLVEMIRRRRIEAIGMGALVAAAALTLVLFAPIIGAVLRTRRAFADASPDTPSPFGIEGAAALLQLGGSLAWWAALPALLVAIAGVVRAGRTPETRSVIVATLAGLPLLFAATWLLDSWMYTRFAFFAFPGGAILIALGVDTLWRRRAAAGVGAIALITACYAADLAVRPTKQPLREAARVVETERRPGERLLVVGLRHEVLDVYAAALDPAYSLHHGADLAAAIARVEPAWVIVLYPRAVGPERLGLLAENGFAVHTRLPGWADWGDGEVVVWRRGE
ncbi:MAG: hypothetical protein HKO59_14385 [Phycisphaerales bacterium]|nr:hypothetical protein [Phycisphaerales bacterium]NNM27148.1 hypothetical protein [Phycisphaerales bacterium]